MNTALDENQFREDNRWDAARVLEVFDSVFDCLKPSEQPRAAASCDGDNAPLADSDIERKIEERTAAKKAKDFKKADEIRGRLLECGVVLEDTKDGVRWKRK